MRLEKAAVILLSVLTLMFIVSLLSRYQSISDKRHAHKDNPVSPLLTLNQTTENKTEFPAGEVVTPKNVIAATRDKVGRLEIDDLATATTDRRESVRDLHEKASFCHFQFHYVINPVEICRSKQQLESSSVFLLNYVHSAVGNFARRARVRASWARKSNYPDDRVETVFFVGLPTGDSRLTTQAAVEAESRQFGDVVQINVVDVYRNMTLKALAALNWMSTYCRHAAYFLKADDDAFVNEFAAIKHLRDIQSAGYRRRLLMCLVWHRPDVARRGKWAVSAAEFAGPRYPTYCSGLGYIVTGDVVALLLSAACQRHQTHHDDVTTSGNIRLHDDVTSDVARNSAEYDVTVGRIFWIDDVYITGILLEAVGGRIKHTDISAAYCKSDKMAVIYGHVTEWYKYLFTHVGDDKTHVYMATWNALKQRAANTSIPSPSLTRPGHLADHYMPRSKLLQLVNNSHD